MENFEVKVYDRKDDRDVEYQRLKSERSDVVKWSSNRQLGDEQGGKPRFASVWLLAYPRS